MDSDPYPPVLGALFLWTVASCFLGAIPDKRSCNDCAKRASAEWKKASSRWLLSG